MHSGRTEFGCARKSLSGPDCVLDYPNESMVCRKVVSLVTSLFGPVSKRTLCAPSLPNLPARDKSGTEHGLSPF